MHCVRNRLCGRNRACIATDIKWFTSYAVRKKAKQVYEMLTDEEKIREEREKGNNIRGVKADTVSSRETRPSYVTAQ